MAKCEFKSLPDAKLQRQRNTSFSFSYNEINISETLSNYAEKNKKVVEFKINTN